MLAAVLGLLAGATLLVLLAPGALAHGQWQIRRPALALLLWFSALGLGCGAVVASVVLATVATVTPDPSRGAAETTILVVLSWVALAMLGGAGTHVLTSSEPLHAATRTDRLAGVATGREQRPGFVLIRTETAEPTVCAVAGPEPQIWLSRAAEQLLTRRQLQAVLAHEYAHLRGRHHWAVRIGAINARCLPRALPAGRALQRSTSLLVELMADDAAARQAGPAELANALAILGAATGALGMDLRAERLAQRRWPRTSRRRLPRAIRLPI